MATNTLAGAAQRVQLPPASLTALRIGRRPMRWRSSAPTLTAIRRDLERASRIATTPTEPAPSEVAS